MNSRKIFWILVVCLLLVLLAPFCGASFLSPFGIGFGTPDGEIFWRLRLPRTIAAFFCGAGLAAGGMVFQAMFRNPLATPFTLGISSGAALGACLYLYLGIGAGFGGLMSGWLASIGSLGAALAGSLLSILLVWLVTRARGGFSTPVMLLAGVVVNFFFASLVLLVQYLADMQDLQRMTRWLLGSVTGIARPRLVDLALLVSVCSICLGRYLLELDLLATGDELAAARGLNVARTRLALFLLASVMVGGIVSIVGPIGFVGMMVPHACRLWLGWEHQKLLPAVLLAGGTFLVLCDVLARIALAPAELPVGIVTAMLGGPFFLWALFRCNRDGEFF